VVVAATLPTDLTSKSRSDGPGPVGHQFERDRGAGQNRVVIEFTDWARDILQRTQTAAARFDPAARVRLARTRVGVEAMLVHDAEPSDLELDAGGVAVFVEQGLEGLVDIEEPHDRLVLRPPGSVPNVRAEH
jgi:hypothetical protein